MSSVFVSLSKDLSLLIKSLIKRAGFLHIERESFFGWSPWWVSTTPHCIVETRKCDPDRRIFGIV